MKIPRLRGIFPKKTEFNSTKNKKIVLWQGFGHKTVYVNSVPQSGYLYRRMWSRAISTLKSEKAPKRVLLLGLGGGTVVSQLRKKYPSSTITAVEIDPAMVDVYKHFFDQTLKGLTIYVADAIDWISQLHSKNSYDLIIVDLFVGRHNPARITTLTFIKNVQKLLSPIGRIWFNVERDPDNPRNFNLFYKRCLTFFTTVKQIYKQPYSHLMCLEQ